MFYKKFSVLVSLFFKKNQKQNGERSIERSLQKVWGDIKDKIKKIFHSDELSKTARQTKFIQRSSAFL
jgi:hypothetical protein